MTFKLDMSRKSKPVGEQLKLNLGRVPGKAAIDIYAPLHYVVQTHSDMIEAFNWLEQRTLISIDTETNWTDRWDDKRLMGFSLFAMDGEEKRGYYFPYRHDLELTRLNNLSEISGLQQLFDRPEITWVYHNAKFDMRIFRQEGFKPSENFYDTMLMSHMHNENYFSHALKWLAVQIIHPNSNAEAEMIKKVRKSIPWEQIPIEVMAKYACKDAELTYYLYQYFLPKLKLQELDHLWDKERQFSLLLGTIENLGIGIDLDNAHRFALEAQTRMQEILDHLGFDPAKPSQLAHRLYGDKSSGGLGLVPVTYSKRPSKEFVRGIPIMDRPNLSTHNHPEVSLVLEYRSLQKALSTWFLGFAEKADTHSRLHPTYKQHGTVTTRLSCSEPNMQQLPRRKDEEEEEGITNAKVKAMLRPAEGYELWEFDVSQAEFRLAAIYGQEQEILHAYRIGDKDFHQITADKLGIPRTAYDGTKREGKTLNFSMLYGAGPKKLAEMLLIGETEAYSLHREFWEEYPSLREAVANATMAAQSRGWVRLWTGRKRHFQNKNEAHKAFNSIIQGGVAEIIKESMLRVDRRGFSSRMIAQVHDSLWFEIPKELEGRPTVMSVEEHALLIKAEMEWPKDEFDIPFPVDMKRLA